MKKLHTGSPDIKPEPCNKTINCGNIPATAEVALFKEV